MNADPCSLTAVDLARAVRAREVSPVEVVEAVHRVPEPVGAE